MKGQKVKRTKSQRTKSQRTKNQIRKKSITKSQNSKKSKPQKVVRKVKLAKIQKCKKSNWQKFKSVKSQKQKVKTALSENHCSRVSVTTYAENKLRGTSYCTYTVNTPPFPSNPGRPVETWNCTRRSGWWADQYWTQSRVSQGHDS